jgi:hypothetical protein
MMEGTTDRSSGNERQAGSKRRQQARSAQGQRQGRAGRGRSSQQRCRACKADRLGMHQGLIDRLVGWVRPLGLIDGLLVHHPR